MRGSLVVLCWVSIDVVLECWIGGDVVSECTEVVFVVMHGCTGKLYCEQGNVLRTEVADVVIVLAILKSTGSLRWVICELSNLQLKSTHFIADFKILKNCDI